MRILMVRPGPTFSVQDVAFGWRDALRRNGAVVADFNFDDRLDFYCHAQMEMEVEDEETGEMVKEFRTVLSREDGVRLAAKGILSACYEFWPDVVLIVSGFFVPQEALELMRARGHKVIALCTESPYEDDKQLELAQCVDAVILNDPTNIEKFRAVNANSFYAPHAYDPNKHFVGPGLPDLQCDFGFVGTGFPSRIELFEAIDWSGLEVVLGGSWVALDPESPLRELVAHRIDWCMDNAEAAELYRSSRTSLNFYRREHSEDEDQITTAQGWSMGPREVELAACGTFFLRDPRPEGDELFPMLPKFTEAREVRPLLDWWLAHDDLREEAALKARLAVEDRTFDAHARWLLKQLDSA